MPSSADGAIGNLRRWLADMAQAVPWAAGSTQYEPSSAATFREELLDRFHTHTQGCRSCSQVRVHMSVMMLAQMRPLVHKHAHTYFVAANARACRTADCVSVLGSGARVGVGTGAGRGGLCKCRATCEGGGECGWVCMLPALRVDAGLHGLAVSPSASARGTIFRDKC